jgi:serine protease Do
MRRRQISFFCVELFLIFIFLVAPALGIPPSMSNGSTEENKTKPGSIDRQRPLCDGTYANDLNAVNPAARKKEQNTRYTYCIRSTATYQCLYYNSDGKIWKKRMSATVHGTAFAYRHQKNATLLLTNEHVVDWPTVTDNDNPVQDIPLGCKLITQALSLVDDENDDYLLDDTKVQRVISDAELDVAVLRTHTRLPIMPFRFGQSAALKQGNAVHVRGFPLAAFQAVNVGKVINPYDRDQEKKWNHIDFVIDALLSDGHSGSPVFAVSCASGEYELVGIYHATYREGSALNVAVSVDEFREVITSLQPRKKRKSQEDLAASDRETITKAMQTGDFPPAIPFGGYTVGVRLKGNVLLYDFFSKKNPFLDSRLAIIEDVPSSGFGRVGRIWFGGKYGLKEYKFSALDQTEQALVERLLKNLQKHLFNIYRYRGLGAVAHKSRTAYDKMRQLDRGDISSGENRRQELSNMLVEIAKNRAPGPDDQTVTIKSLLSPADLPLPKPDRR